MTEIPSHPLRGFEQRLGAGGKLRRLLRARIAINTSYLAASNILQTVLVFLTGLLIARFLGAEQLGVYALASAIGQITARVAEFGIPTILQRMFSRNHPDAVAQLTNAIALRVWTGVITILGIEALAIGMGYTTEVQISLALYTISTLIGGVFSLTSCVYYGRQAMKRPAIAAALFRITSFVVTCIAIAAGLGVKAIIFSLIVGQLVAAVYLATGPDSDARRLPMDLSVRGIGPLLRESYALGIAGIFSILNLRVDQFMLSRYVDTRQLGLYASGFAVLSAFVMIPNTLLPALYPALAQRFHQDRRAATTLFLRVQAVNSIMGIVIACGVGLFAPRLLTLLYGAQFREAGQVLMLLAGAIPCIYLSYTNSVFMTAIDRQSLNMWTSVVAVVVNVGANLVLIPGHGIAGAAWATVLSELASFVCTAVLLWESVREYRRWGG